MRKFWLTVLLLMASMPVMATPQLLDTVNYAGKTWVIQQSPLALYIEQKRISLAAPHSGNRRGYVAHWSIDRDLMLTDVTWSGGKGEAFAQQHMAGLKLPTLARWFTGTLILGNEFKPGSKGEAPFTRTYERYLVLELVEGRIVKRHPQTGEALEAMTSKRTP